MKPISTSQREIPPTKHTRWQSFQRTFCLGGLALSLVWFAACSSTPGLGATSPTPGTPGAMGNTTPTPGSGSTTPSPSSSPAPIPDIVNARILDMLDNIKANGFDSNSSINGGLGGLWINWREGTQPLQVDFNGSGKTDAQSNVPLRHDRLTDLRYLRALLEYKAQHQSDTQFDSEITKYTAIVKADLPGTDDRGWVYDEISRITALDNDPWFATKLKDFATQFANGSYHANIGTVYKTDSTHPNGYYRVDWAIEQGCALIQAGKQFNNADWTSKGESILTFVRAHAYMPQYHIFAYQMDQVLTSSGAANPTETFYNTYDPKTGKGTIGSRIVLGEVAQEILSLLHAYQASGEPTLLSDARDLIDTLSPSINRLGLWDSTNTGYFKQVTFSGTSLQSAGTLQLDNTKKEAGRQGQMLEAVVLANKVTNNAYASMQSALVTMVTGPAYYAPGHGVVYEVRPDWSLVKNSGSSTGFEDWVTTEAMGIALEGLLALGS